MELTWLWCLLSGFAGSLIGTLAGAFLAIYKQGQWRGAVDARIAELEKESGAAAKSRKAIHEDTAKISQLMDWRTTVNQRLEKGAEQMVDIKVLASRMDETNRLITTHQAALVDFNKNAFETFATKSDVAALDSRIGVRCNERHPGRKSAQA